MGVEAGPDDVRGGEAGLHRGEVAGADEVVAVEEQHVLACRGGGPDVAGEAATVAVGRVDHPHGQGAGPALGDGPGAVGRAVVDHHHLPRHAGVVGGERAEQPREVGGGIATGNHDAEGHRRGSTGRRVPAGPRLPSATPAILAAAWPRSAARERTR